MELKERRTVIDIDKSMHRRFKLYAIIDAVKVREVVDEALRAYDKRRSEDPETVKILKAIEKASRNDSARI